MYRRHRLAKYFIYLILLYPLLSFAKWPNDKVLDIDQSVCLGFKIWVFGGKDVQAGFPKELYNQIPKSVQVNLYQSQELLHTSLYHIAKEAKRPHIVLKHKNELSPDLDIELKIEYGCKSSCDLDNITYIIPSVYKYKNVGEGLCSNPIHNNTP
jgi:hypothetical protein